MEVLLTPDILRAARALVGLSQRELEAQAGVARSSIVAAESESAPSPGTILRLRTFYEHKGIEFLGKVDLATGSASDVGVRWRMPEQLPPIGSTDDFIATRGSGIAFAAARGLLNKKQSDLVKLVKISEHKIRSLEAYETKDQPALVRLREYYEKNGIEFLGWGDVSRAMCFGTGVRWRVDYKPKRKGR